MLPGLAVSWGAIGVSALLYAQGSRRPAQGSAARRRDPGAAWRAACFASALAVVGAALAPPLDAAAEQLLWAHMVQHLALLLVAPPLIVLSAPWLELWRGLPLQIRRPFARAVVKSPALRPLRAAMRQLATPAGAFVAFNVNLWAWHAPLLYDLTLRNIGVHALEHALFLATGVLFWAQALPSWPLRRRLSAGGRLGYLLAGSVSAWAMAVVLAFLPRAIYAAYAALPTRPAGISALTDQRLAAGVMWGPGSIPFGLCIVLELYRLLGPSRERGLTLEDRPTGVS